MPDLIDAVLRTVAPQDHDAMLQGPMRVGRGDEWPCSIRCRCLAAQWRRSEAAPNGLDLVADKDAADSTPTEV